MTEEQAQDRIQELEDQVKDLEQKVDRLERGSEVALGELVRILRDAEDARRALRDAL